MELSVTDTPRNVPGPVSCNSDCSNKGWSGGSEDTLVSRGWCSLELGEFGEFQTSLGPLHGLWPDNGLVWLNNGLDDVDAVRSGAVSTGHLAVHLRNSSVERVISVLLVHVDNTGSCKILEDNSVVPDAICFSFEDFANRDDLSLALSNLVLPLHLIPEVGSGDNCVLGKDSDSIARWLGVGFTWKLSTNHPVLLNLYRI